MGLQISNRVVLLDRDGVLNVDRTDSVTHIRDLEVESGAVAATRLLHDAGWTLLVVTNQAAVGRGQLDLDTLHEIHQELDRRLGNTVRGFFVCPHTPEARCACRKPGIALLEQACIAWPFDPGATWFVVDADRDIQAARHAGVRPALVRTGKGAATEPDFPDVPAFDDVLAFARWLVVNER